MLKSKNNKIVTRIFEWLTRFLIKRNFSGVNINGMFNDNGNSVLLIANHVSWWDGFWIMFLNLKVIKRRFHFMMLEEQLRKHWYFQYTGGYSIKKKSKSIIESINYTIELLNKPRNMVFMFPQGKINSIYNDNIEFEQSIERIIKNTQTDNQVIFMVNMIDYFSKSKPSLYIQYKTLTIDYLQDKSIEYEYRKFYKEVLDKQKIKIS